ncbi:MAG: hypothetical protein RBQ97_04140 [Acholeplasma sp.]|nr:hypothetical protein [Acholeplasma sp.]
MKDFFRYKNAIQTTSSKFKFSRVVIPFIGYSILLSLFTWNGNIEFITFFGLIGLVFAMSFISLQENKRHYTLANNYPITYKKRLLYDLLISILTVLVAIGVMVFIFTIIAGTIWIFNGGSIDDGTVTDETIKTSIYTWAFLVWFVTLMIFSNTSVDKKTWSLKLFGGFISALIINIVFLSLIKEKFLLIGNIYIQNENKQLFEYIGAFTYLIFAFILGYFIVKSNKPRLKICEKNQCTD